MLCEAGLKDLGRWGYWFSYCHLLFTPQGVLSDCEMSHIRPDQPRAAVLRLLEYMALLH